MKILVFIELRDDVPTPDSLGVLAKSAALSADTAAIVCGDHIGPLAADLKPQGARRLLVVDHPSLADPVAAPYVDLLAQIRRHYPFDVLLCATSVLTCDLAAGLAARLEAGIGFGLTDIGIRDGALIATRLADNDTILADIAWTTDIRIGLFRPRAFAPAAIEHPDPVIETPDIDLPTDDSWPRIVARSSLADGAHRTGPPLGAADVIVSGGRGIGVPENLDLVRELAALLGGAAGVSLPLVELGWAPRSMQVGQTGTIVQPRLYVACGISGQIQHRIGMENSGTIVAVNRDGGAPIMGFCDLAVVGEFQKIVPPLIALLRQRRAVTGQPADRVFRGA